MHVFGTTIIIPCICFSACTSLLLLSPLTVSEELRNDFNQVSRFTALKTQRIKPPDDTPALLKLSKIILIVHAKISY